MSPAVLNSLARRAALVSLPGGCALAWAGGQAMASTWTATPALVSNPGWPGGGRDVTEVVADDRRSG
jgi:hypothetical protein